MIPLDATEQTFTLEPGDNQRLAVLCGAHDENLRFIEQTLGVTIHNRGHHFVVKSHTLPALMVSEFLQKRYAELQHEVLLTPALLHLELNALRDQAMLPEDPTSTIHIKNKTIKPKGRNQQHYVKQILIDDIHFGVGPAGTGKTYLAVARAVEALEMGRVRRIVLVRPAVEAGERLGFLPGDLAQKVDPYLRPLYDALFDMLGVEKVAKLIEQGTIEIVPLAYMRGRTLNEAFIILDESQNTTKEQMKMFLTRLGFGSIAVITGDLTQIDLPKGQLSGLQHVLQILKDVAGISVTHFHSGDVVRHPLVQRIVDAYAAFEARR